MAKGTDSQPPKNFANVPPQDLYPTSDIRFVMNEQGKLGAKIDRLIQDVEKNGEKLGAVERTIDRFMTSVKVAGAILSVVAIVFWWALGDRITTAVRDGLSGAHTASSEQKPGG